MTTEEAFVILTRIEEEAEHIEYRQKAGIPIYPDYKSLNDGAEKLHAHLRANTNEQLMIECCKVDRSVFGRHSEAYPMYNFLFRIQNLAMARLWGVSKDDIKSCAYFIDTTDGICKNSKTHEPLPRPTATASDDDESHAAEANVVEDDVSIAAATTQDERFANPKVMEAFSHAVGAGLMEKKSNGGVKWKRSNVLLSFFCGIVFCGDEIKSHKYWGPRWYVSTAIFPDKELNNLFGTKNLGQQRLNNLDGDRQKNPPRGYEEILKLISTLKY